MRQRLNVREAALYAILIALCVMAAYVPLVREAALTIWRPETWVFDNIRNLF
jgi:hypothetical protein